MKCPTDGATLTMSERSGIEIDYCPECRGVWLDRGELDKIIDRAGPTAPEPPRQQPRFDDPRGRERRGDDYRGPQPRRRKKENWLAELFD